MRLFRSSPIVHWTTTVLLVLAMGSGGISELLQRHETVAGMRLLGYPAYFVALLGVWKLAGCIVLLIPRWPRLKEWAYAGFVFTMTGAAVSHLAVRDAPWHVWVTLTFAALALVSWATRGAGRVLREEPFERLLERCAPQPVVNRDDATARVDEGGELGTA